METSPLPLEGCKFRPMVGDQGLRAGRDLYRATPIVTRASVFSGFIRRIAPLSRFLRHTWRSEPFILVWIPLQSPLTTHKGMLRTYFNPDPYGGLVYKAVVREQSGGRFHCFRSWTLLTSSSKVPMFGGRRDSFMVAEGDVLQVLKVHYAIIQVLFFGTPIHRY
jgi:hypothetical protein